MINYNDGCQMKLQKVEKLGKSFISSIKIYKRPFTSAIRFEQLTIPLLMEEAFT